MSLSTIHGGLPYAGPGQTVGLFGGSFDPPHPGHRLVTLRALSALGLDWVWWLVTPGNPLKRHDPVHTLEARMAAAGRMAAHRQVKISSIEARIHTRYTADTLRVLCRMRPDLHFVWIMGADNLAGFHRWNEWRTIAAMMPIAVIDRPGSRHAALSAPAAQALSRFRLHATRAGRLAHSRPPAWVMLRGPLSYLSSTALRQAQKQPVLKP